jgi:hypothetical protein
MKAVHAGKWMRMFMYDLAILSLIAAMAIAIAGCGDDDDKTPTGPISQVESLESPFLICGSRNPGGVGFDFVSARDGVAYNMDELPDLEYDLLVRTIKVERPDGNVGGAPYADLYGDTEGPVDAAKAFNASSLGSIETGDAGYDALTAVTAEITAGLAHDAAGFNLSGVSKGDTGFPLYAGAGNAAAQYKKLVIGEAWKKPAKNPAEGPRPNGDEQVWVIRTREGQHVKLMFWDFPAQGAPTATGYVAIKWALLD